ncbi:hypothetical protein [Roseovarius sp. ZX-A-9]|uniref:hypothetical protein n=1 Tax=Roseovarius sp. ZX-A-9 TaxID=3014783 RepID=UPI00232D2713|nr:hypothetical protein [Roseovarius sp. ZX-A-9]
MDEREYALEVYKAFREKVAHEDGLVGQRTIWFVTFQALLFTSFALLTQADDRFEVGIIAAIMTVFGVLGISSAVVTWFSVRAAYESIEATAQKWRGDTDAGVVGVMQEFGGAKLLPGLIGDGLDSGTEVRGRYTALGPPVLVTLAWAVMMVIIWCELAG